MEYHVDVYGKPILDENGEMIPANVCICGAREPLECGCGGWGDVDLDDWYEE